MGLCKTSNVSIFTFINASDLKFCPRSYSSCVYLTRRFKGSNGKVFKMMSHFRTLLAVGLVTRQKQHLRSLSSVGGSSHSGTSISVICLKKRTTE